MRFLRRAHPAAHAGFTLLELSIVLVVIGLLVGGVMAGNELLRASQLQSIATDIEKFKTATAEFKLKYNAIPGDMPDATRYWGTYAGDCTAPATCTDLASCPSTVTCNGNGDGRIAYGASTGAYYEALRYWQHLSNAGMIPGVYTGLPGPLAYSIPNGVGDHRVGLNTPSARFPSTGYGIYFMGRITATAGSPYYPGEYGNSLIIGGQLDAYEPGKSIFTPAEAWSVDKKIDDGKPGTGRLMVRTVLGGGGNTCTNGTSADANTATYRVSVATKQCFMYFNRITE